MTDEELDRARAKEAIDRCSIVNSTYFDIAWTAAMLAREGWTPPDPVTSSHSALMQKWNASGEDYRVSDIVREALKVGVEIGREQKP